MKRYQGMFMREKYEKLPVRKCCIVNLGDFDTGGTHWTGVIKPHKNTLIYIDSFGTPPPEQIVEKESDVNIHYNSKLLQDIKSSICGYFVIDALNNITNVKTFKQL